MISIYKIENDSAHTNTYDDGKIADWDFNQISDLIKTRPIPPEGYKSIGLFFKYNPLSNCQQSNEILEFLIQGMNEPNFDKCLHVLKCLCNILCQGNFEFYDDSIDCEIINAEFPPPYLEDEVEESENKEEKAPTVAVEEEVHVFNHEQIEAFENTALSNTLIKLLAELLDNSDDLQVIYYILKIITHIITKHPTYYMYVQAQMPNVLQVFQGSILNSHMHIPLFKRFMSLFKIYIRPRVTYGPSYRAICEIVMALLTNHGDSHPIVKEAINLCSFFARECQSWITIFKSYHIEINSEGTENPPAKITLYDHLMSLLANDIDMELKRLIVDLLAESYKDPEEASYIDVVIPLINHPDLELQKSVVQCVYQFVFKHPLLVNHIIDGLLQEAATCFVEGPFTIRKRFIFILFSILSPCPNRPDFTEKLLQLGLFTLLVEMIPNVDEKSGHRLFEILVKMVKFVASLGTPEAMAALLASFEEADGDGIYESFVSDDDDDTSGKKAELVDYFNEIMDQIAKFKNALEQQE